MSTPEWEERCAALWSAFDGYEPAAFRAAMDGLTAELPPDDPIGLFERASALDATDFAEEAVARYRESLEAGLDGDRRRQAVIQLASTLRVLGRAAESAAILAAEKANGPSDELDDAADAFLALTYVDLGREREAAVLALRALSRNLVRYRRSITAYTEKLSDG